MIPFGKLDYSKLVFVEKKTKREDVKRWTVNVLTESGSKPLNLYFEFADEVDGIPATGIRLNKLTKASGRIRHSIGLLPEVDSTESFDILITAKEIAKKANENFSCETIKDTLRAYKNEDKERIALWCELIESADGTIFSKFIDIHRKFIPASSLIESMVIRPIVIANISYTKTFGYRMKFTISEACVVKKIDFSRWNLIIPKKDEAIDADDE